MKTTAVNVRAGGAFDVYVGRAVRRAKDPRCRVTSPWANPIKPIAGNYCCSTADAAVQDYRCTVEANIDQAMYSTLVDRAEAVAMLRALLALEGKRLGCWCVPEPCHAAALAALVDKWAPMAKNRLKGWGAA